MNEITNKHLFVTMIVIAVITIGILLSQGRGISYSSAPTYGSVLGASVYDAYNIDYSGSPTRLVRRRYIPVINTSYPISTSQYYQYSTTPSYQQTYSYTYEDQNSYTSTTGGGYDQYGGYMPAGCESGNDYSTVTGEICG